MGTQTLEPENNANSENNDNYYSREYDEGFQPYRTISKPALVSLVIGLLSLAALLSPKLLFVPVIGMVLGLAAVFSIRRQRDELMGSPFAWAGITLSACLFISSAAMHVYIYYTEVPEGYTRISFGQLQPSAEDTARGLPISQKAAELNGAKVFVAGYVHPGVDGEGKVKKFVLVPDMGTCCFGGQPELTDMIEVTIESEHTVRYNARKRKLAGVFRVAPSTKAPGGLEGGYYKLECNLVK